MSDGESVAVSEIADSYSFTDVESRRVLGEWFLRGAFWGGLVTTYQSELEHNYKNTHDELTGLYNRRGLFGIGDQLVKELGTEDAFVGILADIDGLKAVNDTHGHHMGDKALVMVADNLLRYAGGGVVARIGGDEFAILWPLTSVSDVDLTLDQVADKYLAKLRNNNRQLAEQLTVNQDLGLDLSIGRSKVYMASDLAKLGDSAALIDQLLKEADGRMYGHKRSKHKIRHRS